MSAVARLIDANANRAREALRVMEDAARFVLDDARLTADFKSLRHDLRSGFDLLPPGWLEANRNVASDVGTGISNASEMQRASVADLVIAAGKRLTEALRAIEEASKIINPELARTIESLRYRAYALEAAVHARLGSGRATQWSLCLLLTESLCRQPWREVLAAAIEGGVDCVQVREKQMDGGALAQHVRDVIAVARPRSVAVIVNDRADVALAAGADGVHLGTNDLSVKDARRLAGRSIIIGASTHDINEAGAAIEGARAESGGADYCGIGAVFATSLKPNCSPSGVGYLRAFVERYPHTPHLAIGGISLDTIDDVVAAGARGVAVSRAICAADRPRETASRLRAAVERNAVATERETGVEVAKSR